MGQSGRERGFTLVEVILAALLLSLLCLTVWDLFSRYTLFWQRTVHRMDMNDGLRVALSRMCREIRCAEGISAASDAGRLTLVNAAGETVSYYCNLNQLLRREKGVSTPLAGEVASVRFTYVTSAGQEASSDRTTPVSLITVSLTAAKQDNASLEPVVFTQKVRLRVSP